MSSLCCTFQCGRPVQDYTCTTCGSRIGGSNHRLHSTNRGARTYAAQLTIYATQLVQLSAFISFQNWRHSTWLLSGITIPAILYPHTRASTQSCCLYDIESSITLCFYLVFQQWRKCTYNYRCTFYSCILFTLCCFLVSKRVQMKEDC